MRIVQEGSDAAVLLAQAAHSAQLPSPPSISHLALMAVIAPENLALVSSLLQADVNELRQLDTQDKGKGKAVPTDEDVAFALFSQELASLVQAEQDAKLARSLAAAIETDRPVLEALAREEEAARADHALALRLSTEVDNDYDDCVVACQGGGWARPPQGSHSSSSSSCSPPPRPRRPRPLLLARVSLTASSAPRPCLPARSSGCPARRATSTAATASAPSSSRRPRTSRSSHLAATASRLLSTSSSPSSAPTSSSPTSARPSSSARPVASTARRRRAPPSSARHPTGPLPLNAAHAVRPHVQRARLRGMAPSACAARAMTTRRRGRSSATSSTSNARAASTSSSSSQAVTTCLSTFTRIPPLVQP